MILVDFDGTLAIHSCSANELGKPIPRMVRRVKQWRAEGRPVSIFTARAAQHDTSEWGADEQVGRIQAWCLEHLGEALPVTAVKTFDVTEIWDDRAVQVIVNTGLTALEHALTTMDHGEG